MAATAPAFAGFHPDAIQFLADLAENNERAWFQPRKADFERLLKEPMEQLVTAVGERFSARRIPLLADPKRSPFRIYRDTRFSRDKSPYKTHYAATFPWVEVAGGGGEAADDSPHGNGGYFNFQPGEMYAGGTMSACTRSRWPPPSSPASFLVRPVADELDPREAERIRRRDHDLEAERRALMNPGMGKVFKQIQDAMGKAAKDASSAPKPKRQRRPKV